jgi:hypothetical protein
MNSHIIRYMVGALVKQTFVDRRRLDVVDVPGRTF